MTIAGEPQQTEQGHASWQSVTPVEKALDVILVLSLVCFFALPFITSATGEQSDFGQAGKGGCDPGNTYDPNLPDTETDPQGKQGLIGLSCWDTTDGISTPGKCISIDKCEATNPKGAPHEQIGSPAQNSQVSPDQPLTAPTQVQSGENQSAPLTPAEPNTVLPPHRSRGAKRAESGIGSRNAR